MSQVAAMDGKLLLGPRSDITLDDALSYADTELWLGAVGVLANYGESGWSAEQDPSWSIADGGGHGDVFGENRAKGTGGVSAAPHSSSQTTLDAAPGGASPGAASPTPTAVPNMQPSLALTICVPTAGIFPSSDPGSFLGELAIFAGNYNPAGLLAEGQVLSISQNAALFSLLGTNYGGNGTSNFEIPNLVDATLVGAGQGPGLNSESLGEPTGANNFTLTNVEKPPDIGGASQAFSNYQSSLPISYIINLTGVFPSQGGGSASQDIIGAVVPFAGNFAPDGWAFCDGQLLSIAQNEVIYNMIRTTYGGDGVNTFALPDLRGRSIIGQGSSTGAVGTNLGAPTVSLTNSQAPDANGDAPQPFDNDQPSLVMTYLIALTGIFPSEDGTELDPNTPYLGEIIAFAGNFAPSGWALCDGQLLSINQNQALFAVLGTNYGGNGTTTFALPNLEGRTVVGQGPSVPVGTTLGSDFTTITSSELPPGPPYVGAAAAIVGLTTQQLANIQNAGFTGLEIKDSAANVAADIDAIEADGHVTSIVLTDSGTPTLTLDAAKATTDATALGLIIGAYLIAITDTSAAIAAHEPAIDALIASGRVVSVDSSGATLAVASGVTLSVAGADDTINAQPGAALDLVGGWDTVSLSGLTISLNGARASVFGGDEVISFAGGAGDAASLYETSGNWDEVSGSGGTLYFSNAQASVFGGGDTIDLIGTVGNQASFYATEGDWDAVTGSDAVLYLSDAQASVFGGGDVINMLGSAGNQVSLYATSGNWDTIVGDDATTYLTDAQASVFGGGDTIDLIGTTGNQASLYATAGVWDAVLGVNGGDGTIYLTDAQASVIGGGDVINLLGTTGNQVSLYATAGTWDAVAGDDATIYFTNAQASVFGGGDALDLIGTVGNQASLYSTSGHWDSVTSSDATLYLTDAQASVFGAGNTINFSGATDNAVSIYETSGSADTINGAEGALYLTNAQAVISGAGHAVVMAQGSLATAMGAADTFVFSSAIGVEVIDGFNSSDAIQLAASDFASWQVLSNNHLAQSGADAVITYDTRNTVTLTNVNASSLTSAQFSFV